MTRPETVADIACHGMSWLFDSTTAADHASAKAICATCPVFDWCVGELEDVLRQARATGIQSYGPAGTWAGQLLGVPRGPKRRAA